MDQKVPKMRKKCLAYAKKLYYTLIMKLMNLIFGMFTHLIWVCDIYILGLNYN